MPEQTILVAEDDASVRLIVSQTLSSAGYKVRATPSIDALEKWVDEGQGDAVVSDVHLGNDSIFERLSSLKRARPQLPFIIMSGNNTILTAAAATEHGAFDYLPKPFDIDELTATVGRALVSSPQAKATLSALEASGLPLIGRSDAMQEVYRVLTRVMNTDLSILIDGEPGTGKELTARAIHDLGNRKGLPYTVIGPADIEAFSTDADAIELASSGTLFLDEVEEFSPQAQLKLVTLLRSPRELPRIIASSQAKLAERASKGLFREDLYHRLGVVRLTVPPLRDRKEDIPELAQAFLLRAADKGLPEKSVSAQAIERLQLHDWPGNVRELENTLLRLAALSSDPTISVEQVEADLAASIAEPAHTNGDFTTDVEALLRQYIMGEMLSGENEEGVHRSVIEAVEAPLIRLALQVTKGNRVKAAGLLGLNRNTLRAKMTAMNISDH